MGRNMKDVFSQGGEQSKVFDTAVEQTANIDALAGAYINIKMAEITFSGDIEFDSLAAWYCHNDNGIIALHYNGDAELGEHSNMFDELENSGNVTLEQLKNYCSNLPTDEKARLDGIAKFAAEERNVPINNQSEFYSSLDAS